MVAVLSQNRFTIIFFSSVVFLIITIYTTSKSSNRQIPFHSPPPQPNFLETRNNTSNVEIPDLEKLVKVGDYLKLNIDEMREVEDEKIYLKLCPDLGSDIKIVFVITSSPNHENAREVIRRTWGSLTVRNDIAITFLIGLPTDDKIAEKIENEQLLHGDIIRGNFLDSYDNLTLKTTWMLYWLNKYCPKALYSLKTDDDVFLNVDLLLESIDQHKITPNRSIYGRVVESWIPVRDKSDKYYISKSQFKPDTFPPFTTGPAYIFATALAKELYQEALSLPYVKLEDVFYNGIVATRLNISRVNITEFVNKWVELEDCILIKTISIHGIWGEYLYYIWYRINSIDKKKCN